MRTFILSNSILLLSAVLAIAQDVGNLGNASNTASRTITVEGCLGGALGSYTLTDSSGATYPLTGDTEGFKDNVGSTMQVTGLVRPVLHVPGAMGEGTRPTQPTIDVVSAKEVYGICREYNNIP
jgi:hypothetical protein